MTINHPGTFTTGPAAATQLSGHLGRAVQEISAWMAEFGPYTPHVSLEVDSTDLERSFDELVTRLRNNSSSIPGTRVRC